MTYEQKIEEAARKHAKEYENLGESVVEAAEFDFKSGVQWARENPDSETALQENKKLKERIAELEKSHSIPKKHKLYTKLIRRY